MPAVSIDEHSHWRGVWVVAEPAKAELEAITIQLLGAGRELADQLEEELAVVLMGHGVADLAQIAAGYGADKAFVADHPTLSRYSTLPYAHVLSQLITQFKPNIVLAGATCAGRDLIPRVAARVQTGVTADAVELRIDEEGRFVQVNPGYGGNVLAVICTPGHRPQMVTVRPNALPTPERCDGRNVEVVDVSHLAEGLDNPLRLIAVHEAAHAADASLAQARVIIGGGRGLKSKENFERLYELAELVGGAVAATRAVVDEGWAPPYCQVGQTGITVQPDLYVAFGISGAIQHTAGIRGAGTIVAVNIDASAPIFDIADYGFVADAVQVLDQVIELVRSRRGERA